MDNNTIQSVLQSVASKYQSDRDSEISKINRILDAPYDPEVDVEGILYECFKKWAMAELSINRIATTAQQMQKQLEELMKKQGKENLQNEEVESTETNASTEVSEPSILNNNEEGV